MPPVRVVETQSRLRLVVAVHPEARPLVDRYRLRRDSDSRFPVYDGELELDDTRHAVSLIVSGVGKAAAAAATGYLAASRPAAMAVWLNVGIAGHRDQSIGAAYAVHRIRDAGAQRNFFPSLVGCRMDSRPLTTVDRPERDFDSEELYDMEGSAFYEAALNFSPTELIQCLKIVSDNRLNPADGLTKESITGLVSDRLEELDALAVDLTRLARSASAQIHEPAHVESFVNRWHFSRTQRLRLHHLLRRAELLLEETLDAEQFAGRHDSREVLSDLEEMVEASVLRRAR